MSLFFSLVGQDFNLGDTVLRRALVSNLWDGVERHVWVGAHSEDYIDALGLSSRDVIYRNYEDWQHAIIQEMRQGPIVYIDSCGEILTDPKRVRRRFNALRLNAKIVVGRGKLIAAGVAMQVCPRWVDRVRLRILFSFYTIVAWRDTRSRWWSLCGNVMPDWAFVLGGNDMEVRANSGRRYLVFSLRGDRPPPSEQWLAIINRFCLDRNLEPIGVSQVRIDNDVVKSTAHLLKCKVVEWKTESTHKEHEEIVRSIYSKSALVVSDRLHVLIMAMTEGAVPACMTSHNENKIQRHFDAVGAYQICYCVGDNEQNGLSFLHSMMSRSDEMREIQTAASAEVRRWSNRINDICIRTLAEL